jgi:hypothetical protein
MPSTEHADFELRLTEKFRIGLLVDPPQWVLSRIGTARDGRPRYKGMSYCQHKETLMRAIREKIEHGFDFYGYGAHNIKLAPEVRAQLDALPDTAKLHCIELGYTEAGTDPSQTEDEVEDDQNEKHDNRDLQETRGGIR